MTGMSNANSKVVNRQGSSSNNAGSLQLTTGASQINVNAKNHGDFEISPKNSNAP